MDAPQIATASAVDPTPGRLSAAMALIQLFCGLGFAIDLAVEFPDPRGWADLSARDLTHLVSELAMMVLLLAGFAIARRLTRLLAAQRDMLKGNLASLRGDFDRILHRRFDDWRLSPAQRDVALLCLRGLRIAEIAAARGSAEGTVKAHLGAVFRAAGVRGRSELMALFMEEFLDHGAAAAG